MYVDKLRYVPTYAYIYIYSAGNEKQTPQHKHPSRVVCKWWGKRPATQT